MEVQVQQNAPRRILLLMRTASLCGAGASAPAKSLILFADVYVDGSIHCA